MRKEGDLGDLDYTAVVEVVVVVAAVVLVVVVIAIDPYTIKNPTSAP